MLSEQGRYNCRSLGRSVEREPPKRFAASHEAHGCSRQGRAEKSDWELTPVKEPKDMATKKTTTAKRSTKAKTTTRKAKTSRTTAKRSTKKRGK